MSASGAILELCGYYVLFFIFNLNNINNNMKFCAIIFFVVIFLNLFSGISEGSNQVDIHSHIDFLKNIRNYYIIFLYGF